MHVVTDPALIEGYLTDASNIRGQAEGLVRPTSAAEVAAVLAEAQRSGTPVTVVAGRTSTTAGAVPQGGMVLSMERLDRVIEITETHAIAEGGVLLGALQAEIEAKGRFYPPDPTSRHECSLGASIACNASGARSFKYGSTRPWIEALQVALPTGELLEVGPDDLIPADWPVPHWVEPKVKTAAGYAPARRMLDLFIGQEGTLGVITRATVRLTELPTQVLGVMAYFPSREAALRFVRVAREAQRANPDGALSPRCLEYLDRHCLALAQQRVGGVPEGAVAALFCEQEDVAGEDAHLEAWFEALTEAGALADDTLVTNDPAGREALLRLRHAIPAGVNEQVVANGMPKVGTDLSVPDTGISELMDAYEAAPVPHVLFGHLGDNHLHLNLLPRSAEELATARAYYDELARLAIRLGGSVSAEHGIGKLKRKHLSWMVGDDTLSGFQALKAKLDPRWILGRGNLLDVPAERVAWTGVSDGGVARWEGE